VRDVFGRRKRQSQEPVDSAPGWDALERRVRDVLPGATQAQHWGTDTLPGQGGVYGISAFRSGETWLYLTFGLSELFAKESDDLEVSGWGFELTMRVPRSGDTPPTWPVTTLSKLGRYVFTSGTPFEAGHRIGGGGFTDDPTSRLDGLAFAVDPELWSVDTPNGRVTFLAAVGVTADELELMRSTTSAAVLEGLKQAMPLLVTDPARR